VSCLLFTAHCSLLTVHYRNREKPEKENAPALQGCYAQGETFEEANRVFVLKCF
jgi:hypothetical protein